MCFLPLLEAGFAIQPSDKQKVTKHLSRIPSSNSWLHVHHGLKLVTTALSEAKKPRLDRFSEAEQTPFVTIILKPVRDLGKGTRPKSHLIICKVNVKEAEQLCFSSRITASGLPNTLQLGPSRNRRVINFPCCDCITLCNYPKATVERLSKGWQKESGKESQINSWDKKSYLLHKANKP